jgi:two-component system, NtrC family, response regulator AtoC
MSDEFDEESTSIQMQVSVREILGSDRLRRLTVMEGPGFDGESQELLLGDAPVVIGRSRRADVRMDTASLSRLHVRLAPREYDYEITDLDSRNGLFVNGIRVRSALLRDGDVVQIGDVILRYRDQVQ